MFGVPTKIPKYAWSGEINTVYLSPENEGDEDVEGVEEILYFRVQTIQGDNVYIDPLGVIVLDHLSD